MRLLVATALLAADPALAGDIVQGANTLAMGGVGAAAPNDNAGISMNPGLLGLEERYDFHGHFRLDQTLGMQWAASALDARTSDVVSMGLAYSGDRFEPPLRTRDLPGWTIPGEELGNLKSYHDFTGGLAVALLERKLSLGFGGNFGMYSHEQQGSGTYWDLHAGIGVQPIEALTFGLAVRDFVPGTEEDRPLNVLSGVRVDSDLVSVEANLGWVSETSGERSPFFLGGGFEVPAGTTRLRLGGRWDGPVAQPWITGGIGYEGEDGAIEYGLAVPVGGELGLGATIHQVSVRFGAPADIPQP